MNLHDILGIVEKTRWMGENSPIVANIRYSNPKVCVITGPNVSGKSLLRKIINVHHRENKVEFIHLSQAGRCESGIMKAMIYGNEQDDSTGYNTLKTMLTAIKTGISRENSFTLFFDEPEIGCSEELAAGMAIRLIKNIDLMKNLFGLIIVSHSKQFLSRFVSLSPTHIHLGGDYVSLSDWVNREIVPVEDLEGLQDLGHKRWSAIEKMMRKV